MAHGVEINTTYPRIWKAIPLNIRISPSVSSFKRNFKNVYFAADF